MEWYYGQNGQQVGPVTETQLDDLVRAGTINATTLIWREGMSQWQPLQVARPGAIGMGQEEQAGAVAAPPPAPGAATAPCSECHRLFPQSEMVVLNRAWVCASCKPIFVQRLKEGVGPVGGELWRYRRQLVLRQETPLPDRCVKCNAPAQGGRLKRKLSWHPPGFYLLVLVNLLVYAIVAIIVRKRATLEIGLCEAHRKRRQVIIIGSWLSVVVGLGLFIYGINSDLMGLLGFGLFLLLAGGMVGLILARQIAAAKIDKEFVWVTGVCKDYLAELPEWNGP